MYETSSQFDAADYLKTDENIAAYLDVAAQEDDPHAMARALGTIARVRRMSEVAKDPGLGRNGAGEVLSHDGNPAFATVAKIARALGFDVTFRAVEHSGSTALRT